MHDICLCRSYAAIQMPSTYYIMFFSLIITSTIFDCCFTVLQDIILLFLSLCRSIISHVVLATSATFTHWIETLKNLKSSLCSLYHPSIFLNQKSCPCSDHCALSECNHLPIRMLYHNFLQTLSFA